MFIKTKRVISGFTSDALINIDKVLSLSEKGDLLGVSYLNGLGYYIKDDYERLKRIFLKYNFREFNGIDNGINGKVLINMLNIDSIEILDGRYRFCMKEFSLPVSNTFSEIWGEMLGFTERE